MYLISRIIKRNYRTKQFSSYYHRIIIALGKTDTILNNKTLQPNGYQRML
jgi:hypothetical protein